MAQSREVRIAEVLKSAFKGAKIFLENESMHHLVPPNSETHFKLLVISDDFLGISKVGRQRMVYGPLNSEFKAGLHALTLRALTTSEWESGQGENFISPECMSKAVASTKN